MFTMGRTHLAKYHQTHNASVVIIPLCDLCVLANNVTQKVSCDIIIICLPDIGMAQYLFTIVSQLSIKLLI